MASHLRANETSQDVPSDVPIFDIDDECWSVRSEARTRVLGRVKDILKAKLGRRLVPPPFWAFCQVADISRLEHMVDIAEQAPTTEIAMLCLEPTLLDCDTVIERCESFLLTQISLADFTRVAELNRQKLYRKWCKPLGHHCKCSSSSFTKLDWVLLII